MPSFQWRKDGADVAGATGPSIRVNPAERASYSCDVAAAGKTRSVHVAHFPLANVGAVALPDSDG